MLVATERWCKGLTDMEAKPQCHSTAPLPSRGTSARKCSTGSRNLVPRFLEVRFSTRVRFDRGIRNTWQNPGGAVQLRMNATSRRLMHCFYETSHNAGKTERGNRETITPRNVMAGLFRTFRNSFGEPMFLLKLRRAHLATISVSCAKLWRLLPF